jgi:predicted protein tyrosine phosphatase
LRPQIYVCSLDEMPTQVRRLRPGRLISLLPDREQPSCPREIATSNHLRVIVRDCDNPDDGPDAPARHHIQTLVEFVRATPPDASILIHCLAGISRSPAAALIAMVLDAPGREHDAALHMRTIAPHALPNRLMVALADDLLGRSGALVAATAAMGPPDWTREPEMIVLPRSFAPGKP